MSKSDLERFADSVMAYDYGRGPAAATVRPADFGQDPGTAYHPGVGPAVGYPHMPIPLHPTAAHQSITVKTPSQSFLGSFLFQLAAAVTGGYITQRFIVPRMHHHGG